MNDWYFVLRKSRWLLLLHMKKKKTQFFFLCALCTVSYYDAEEESALTYNYLYTDSALSITAYACILLPPSV